MILPFYWTMCGCPDEWRSQFQPFRTLRTNCTPLFPTKKKPDFQISLREEQQQIYHEMVETLHKNHGSVLLSLYPGGGKTITSIYVAYQIGLRTVIFTHRIVLMDQWVESIERCFRDSITSPSLRICRLEGGNMTKDSLPEADIYVVNAINVPKWTPEQWAEKRIGTVIVDECHVMVTSVFVKALACIAPRYLIGLSATPYRPDGYDTLLHFYFGKQPIVRSLFRPHRVLVHKTPWEAPDVKDRRGQRLWDPVLEFQATFEPRLVWLVDTLLHPSFQDRHMLILCKRKQHILRLRNLFLERGISELDIATLYGSQTQFRREARFLLASFQKVGVGFSHDILDMLVLATDCEEYFLQYLGRVFRRPDVEPIILDVQDIHPSLQRHFYTRRSIYRQSGGQLQTLTSFLSSV